MIRSIILALSVLAIGLPAQVDPVSSGETQAESVQDLVAKIKAREKSVGSVLLEMKTSGTYPDGVTYLIQCVATTSNPQLLHGLAYLTVTNTVTPK